LGRTKVIIYDCDGVIFDSKQANEAFYNHILNHFNLPPLKPEQLDFVHSSTADGAIDYIFQSDPLGEEAKAYRKTIDYRIFLPLMRLEPCVREVLEYLHPRYHTAIATNRSQSMPLVLRDSGLEPLFDIVVTSMDVAEPKPHPESLWKILDYFNAEPGDTLYVGDTEVDQLVCQRVDIPFVSYKNLNLKADYYLQHHMELLKILESQLA